MDGISRRIPAVGDVLANQFALDEQIGRGGMGLVFRGRQLSSGRVVAVKVLTAEASTQEDAIPRFVNEARATSQLKTTHVVRMLDAGTTEEGIFYIVMELLEGSDLFKLIHSQGPLTVARAVDYIIQAGEAVAEAHALGIVHRDLKPSNLFLANVGSTSIVKVLDFGVSKVASGDARSQALTATGAFLGSPHYMSPEQLKNAKDVDGRADIWSLGAILYELLVGKSPFDAGAFGAIFVKVLAADFEPLSKARPDVPPELVEVVHRCLKRDRAERFRDVPELVQHLRTFVNGPPPPRPLLDQTLPLASSAYAHLARPPAPPPPPPPPPEPRRSGARRPPPGPSRMLLGAAVIVVLLLIAAAILVVLAIRAQAQVSSTAVTPSAPSFIVDAR